MAEYNDYNSSLTAQDIESTLLGAVVHNKRMVLTEAQKAQARDNIGAGTSDSGMVIKGFFATKEELEATVTSPKAGDSYGVGAAAPYDIYIWDGLHNMWYNNGNIRGADGTNGVDGKDAVITPAQVEAGLGYNPGMVNPNLLVNWYFVGGGGTGRFPVNQMGKTSYTGSGYGIDRWRTNFSGDTVSIEANGVKNVNASTSAGWHLHQIISEGVSNLVGNAVTTSFLVADYKGDYLKPLLSFRNSSDSEISSVAATTIENGMYSVTGIVPNGTAKIRVGFYSIAGIASGEYVTVAAAKLELGSVQTLARWVDGRWALNELPDYTEQLAKCRRSQYVVEGYLSVYGVLTSDKKSLLLFVPTPEPMRTKPALRGITVSGIRTTAGTNVTPTITSQSVDSFTPSGVNVVLATEAFNTDSQTNNTPVFAYVRTAILDANE